MPIFSIQEQIRIETKTLLDLVRSRKIQPEVRLVERPRFGGFGLYKDVRQTGWEIGSYTHNFKGSWLTEAIYLLADGKFQLQSFYGGRVARGLDDPYLAANSELYEDILNALRTFRARLEADDDA